MARRPGLTIARDTKPTAVGAFISSDMTLPGVPLPLDAGTAQPEPEERWTLGGRPDADEASPDVPVERVRQRQGRAGAGDR